MGRRPKKMYYNTRPHKCARCSCLIRGSKELCTDCLKEKFKLKSKLDEGLISSESYKKQILIEFTRGIEDG